MPTMAEAALQSLLLLLIEVTSNAPLIIVPPLLIKIRVYWKIWKILFQTIAAATTTIAAFTATISNVNMKRVGIFSWNFENVNKICLETFCHRLVGSLNCLRMLKLQFFSVNCNLITKFFMEKSGTFVFSTPEIVWSLNLYWRYHLTNKLNGYFTSGDWWSWLVT